MQNLTIQKACHLGKLTDELIAAIPALAPTPAPGGGPDGRDAHEARFRLSGNATSVTLEFPDNVALVSVQGVINAHNPAPPPPHPDASLPQALRDKLAEGNTIPLTPAEEKQILRFMLRSI